MPRRVTFTLQEGGSIVRASFEVGTPSASPLVRADERGLLWYETAICLMTLQTWAHPLRVLELLRRNFLEDFRFGRPFKLEGFNPTYLRSDTPFGRIYQKTA
jgi:hypothetical protein